MVHGVSWVWRGSGSKSLPESASQCFRLRIAFFLDKGPRGARTDLKFLILLPPPTCFSWSWGLNPGLLSLCLRQRITVLLTQLTDLESGAILTLTGFY